MNIFLGIIFYIFVVSNMTFSALYWWRDASKKTRIRVLVIGQILLHIGMVFAYFYTRSNAL